jgi:hypothetical protein
MLDFRIELGADQNHDCRHPHPGHKADDRAERTIGFVKASEIRCIPREQGGSGELCGGGECATPADPFPPRFCTARAIPVDHRQPYRDKHQQNRPSSDVEKPTRDPRSWNVIEHHRESDNAGERNQQERVKDKVTALSRIMLRFFSSS